MVTKLKKPAADQASSNAGATGAQLAQSVKESAQQIWLAGLGAFSKAQAEGGKVFEALVKDGLGLQRKTQAAAEEKISEATQKMTTMASDISSKATGMAQDLSSKATGQWDKLESIFEDRVAKALKKMGMPTAAEVQALSKRVDALSAQLKKVPSKSAAAPKAAVKAVVKKVLTVKNATAKRKPAGK